VLKLVLASFKKENMTRPIGWTIESFLGFYDMLEGYLLIIVEDFRKSGNILGTLNSKFIALIPKGKNPTSFEESRPISLFHFVYKFILKVLLTSLNGFNLVLFNMKSLDLNSTRKSMMLWE